jgi:dolichyl-phosphate-mannose--protein O-mannosyl transferase
MSEARNTRYVNEYVAETPVESLTFDQRWARWQEKGARDDQRVGRNMRLLAVIALTLGVIWFFVLLR